MSILGTERLYYNDAYLRTFSAHVIGRRQQAGRFSVALDRTAFYPTGGGQPHDTGTLNGVPVVDVVVERGLIWHVLDGLLPDDEVTGVIDWDRRFDHMQQHTGQHILSQAFIQTMNAETVGFHLGARASTIDLNRVGLGPDALVVAETTANAVIDAAWPVTAKFLDEADLDRVPLRKPPKVSDHIRVVQVDGFDWSACGGTHVANTAQIGLIKIVGTERRGAETRISFLCGGRARADYARLQTLIEGLASRFTTGQEQLLDAVDRLIEENKAVRHELGQLEAEWVAYTAAALWADAERHGPWRVVAKTVDYPVGRTKRVAQTLRSQPGTVVFLGIKGKRPQLIFTRADDVALHIGDLLRSAAAAGGGKGGGRPDWAQGGVPAVEALDVALATALMAIK